MYPLSIVLFECASSMEVLMSDHIHKDPLQHCELEIEKFLPFLLSTTAQNTTTQFLDAMFFALRRERPKSHLTVNNTPALIVAASTIAATFAPGGRP